VAFIGQRRGEPLNSAIFQSISRNIEGHNIEDNYIALFQNLRKPSLKSTSTIYDYVKVQQLDDICQISVGDKKQTRRQNMVLYI
jgi:hypothetical protein